MATEPLHNAPGQPDARQPGLAGPPASGQRYSRLTTRPKFLAAWAAAGLLLLGGAGTLAMLHRGERPHATTAFCGLVACWVPRSTAAVASLPTAVPSPDPAPSATLTQAAAPAVTHSPQPAPAAPPAAPSWTQRRARPWLPPWPWRPGWPGPWGWRHWHGQHRWWR